MIRNLLHDLLFAFFHRFGYSLQDGGYELLIRDGGIGVASTFLSYFSGWVPYPGYEVYQVYVLLHSRRRTWSLYSCNDQIIEHEEFPDGEFPRPRYYPEPPEEVDWDY